MFEFLKNLFTKRPIPVRGPYNPYYIHSTSSLFSNDEQRKVIRIDKKAKNNKDTDYSHNDLSNIYEYLLNYEFCRYIELSNHYFSNIYISIPTHKELDFINYFNKYTE